MSTVNQITNGAFQDSEGNLLANGYLIFELNQDSIVNTNVQVCAGYKIKVQLNASGKVPSSPVSNLWPNDVLTPSGTFYLITGYTSSGELVYGPVAAQILSTPSPFDLGAIIP